jgi:hypothetical protein
VTVYIEKMGLFLILRFCSKRYVHMRVWARENVASTYVIHYSKLLPKSQNPKPIEPKDRKPEQLSAKWEQLLSSPRIGDDFMIDRELPKPQERKL